MADRDEPVLVTTAARSPAEDRRTRERRYLITMGVRVVAFIVAIVFARGWVLAIAIPLSLVLPWVAVVAANAGPSRTGPERSALFTARARREVTGSQHSAGREDDAADDNGEQ